MFISKLFFKTCHLHLYGLIPYCRSTIVSDVEEEKSLIREKSIRSLYFAVKCESQG